MPPVLSDKGRVISLFFLLYCSVFCIFKCKYVFFSSVPHCVQSFFLLLFASILADPEILLSSDWYQKLLWRLRCPTELGDKAVFCWSWVVYYLHKHNYLWRLAVVFGVWEAAWCDRAHCFGVSCHASDTQKQSLSFLSCNLVFFCFFFLRGVIYFLSECSFGFF